MALPLPNPFGLFVVEGLVSLCEWFVGVVGSGCPVHRCVVFRVVMRAALVLCAFATGWVRWGLRKERLTTHCVVQVGVGPVLYALCNHAIENGIRCGFCVPRPHPPKRWMQVRAGKLSHGNNP